MKASVPKCYTSVDIGKGIAGGQDMLSPYQAMGNNPANYVDPDGKQLIVDASDLEMIDKLNAMLGNGNYTIGDNGLVSVSPGMEGELFGNLIGFFLGGGSIGNIGGGDMGGPGTTLGAAFEFATKIYNAITNADPASYSIAPYHGKMTFGTYGYYSYVNILGEKVNGEEKTNQNASTSHDWYKPTSRANWFIGLGATALENTSGTFRLTNGAYNGSAFSFKYYPSGWRGGSKALITTYNITKIGKGIGYGLYGLGIALDIRGMWIYKNDPNSPNAVTPTRFGVNTTMSTYGLFINPIAPILYFGVDAFYPGGWLGDSEYPGAIRDQLQLLEENRAVIPDFHMYKDGPGW